MDEEEGAMYYVGVDLGQRRDHSAIAVIERMELYSAYRPGELHHLQVRYLERVPLGTPYPGVVERVRRIVGCGEIRGNAGIAVDATGVGAPVVELLRAARLGCEVTAVTITGGDKASSNAAGHNVPKRDLIAGLQVLLEKEQLRIAKGLKDAGALVRELLDMRANTRATGNVKLGADGEGEHDDLVIAVALGCWRAKWSQIGFGHRRLL